MDMYTTATLLWNCALCNNVKMFVSTAGLRTLLSEDETWQGTPFEDGSVMLLQMDWFLLEPWNKCSICPEVSRGKMKAKQYKSRSSSTKRVGKKLKCLCTCKTAFAWMKITQALKCYINQPTTEWHCHLQSCQKFGLRDCYFSLNLLTWEKCFLKHVLGKRVILTLKSSGHCGKHDIRLLLYFIPTSVAKKKKAAFWILFFKFWVLIPSRPYNTAT